MRRAVRVISIGGGAVTASPERCRARLARSPELPDHTRKAAQPASRIKPAVIGSRLAKYVGISATDVGKRELP